MPASSKGGGRHQAGPGGGGSSVAPARRAAAPPIRRVTVPGWQRHAAGGARPARQRPRRSWVLLAAAPPDRLVGEPGQLGRAEPAAAGQGAAVAVGVRSVAAEDSSGPAYHQHGELGSSGRAACGVAPQRAGEGRPRATTRLPAMRRAASASAGWPSGCPAPAVRRAIDPENAEHLRTRSDSRSVIKPPQQRRAPHPAAASWPQPVAYDARQCNESTNRLWKENSR